MTIYNKYDVDATLEKLKRYMDEYNNHLDLLEKTEIEGDYERAQYHSNILYTLKNKRILPLVRNTQRRHHL